MFIKHLHCVMHSGMRLARKGTVLATLTDIPRTIKGCYLLGLSLCLALSPMLYAHSLIQLFSQPYDQGAIIISTLQMKSLVGGPGRGRSKMDTSCVQSQSPGIPFNTASPKRGLLDGGSQVAKTAQPGEGGEVIENRTLSMTEGKRKRGSCGHM